MPEEFSNPMFVLASRSPRRQQLLREAGYEFVVDPADVDEEDYPPEIMPADLAVRLARMKAYAVAARRTSELILAADTVVALGDRILGKPKDILEARYMLRLLSGTTHLVITGVALVRRSDAIAEEKRVISAVQMRELSQDQIEKYALGGEWAGKAGGYGIQDNDPFVKCLAGDYTNIVGLPMKITQAMLADVGVMPRK
jgi:septum formation protein